VNQTAQVIDFLRINLLNQNTPIYLIGNSQGGHVAAKYSDLYPDNVQKIVMYACSAFDRCSEEIFDIRLKAELQELTQQDAVTNISRIYVRYQNMKNWVEQHLQDTVLQQYAHSNISNALNIYSTINNYSFEYQNISLNHLLNIQIPILVVYGTKDTKSLLNEYLPLYFTKNNKHNLTMMPILNCDHVFVRCTDNKYVGDEVLAKIIAWFDENH
jgi:pimeloyl-ACP methyl ester carboxylesterase